MSEQYTTIIKEIIAKLEYLCPQYCVSNDGAATFTPSYSIPRTIYNEHHHYHGSRYNYGNTSWSPFFWHPIHWPRGVTNNTTNNTTNNYYSESSKKKGKKEKDDEENDNSHLIVGGIIVTVASLGSTYVLSKDDYIKMWRLDINSDLDKLLKQSKDHESSDEINEAVNKCRKFVNSLENKSGRTFWGKAGFALSSIGVGGGMYCKNDFVVKGSLVGGLLSSCYLLWNYMDKNSSYNVGVEKRMFDDVVGSLLRSGELVE